jgi:hypothetical protein
MRKEAYQILKKRLQQLIIDEQENICFITAEQLQEMIESGITPNYAINHIGLWNRQVEFIESESAFPMPAIFIEFGKIQWRSQGKGIQDAELTIGLHVLTNAVPEGYDGELFHLDLLDKINYCLHGFNSGCCLGTLERTISIPCHDHEEILDETEVFRCVMTDDSAVKKRIKIKANPNISVS